MAGDLITRRAALALGGSFALAAGLQGRGQAQAGSRRIDVHHHYFSPGWLAKRKDQITESGGARFSSWTPKTAVEAMDQANCSMAVVSLGGPGCWYGKDSVESNRAIAREVNEFGARMVADHKGRFGFFASIGLPDTEGSLKEIAYSLDTLKADGILVWSNFDGRFLGDPGFLPAFEELNRRKAVVYIHPKVTSDLSDANDPLRAIGINWQNTTRNISSMLASGTLAKCPDIKFIISHGGGLLPMVAVRMAGDSPEKLALLKKLYVDTAQTTLNPGAWAAQRAFMQPSHVLFGSDYPYANGTGMLEGLKAVTLTPAEAAGIDHGHAETLFPRLRA